MELSVRETAVVLGVSPRTVRARLARGELHGTKRGKSWRIRRESLPLTEAQRERLQARADSVRAELEAALPPRRATRHGSRRRSVEDFDAFRSGREVLWSMSRDERAGEARVQEALRELEQALLDLCEGTYDFDVFGKHRVWSRARSSIGRCIGHLLLAAEAESSPCRSALQWVEALESGVLPPLAGLLRWCERRGDRNRRGGRQVS